MLTSKPVEEIRVVIHRNLSCLRLTIMRQSFSARCFSWPATDSWTLIQLQGQLFFWQVEFFFPFKKERKKKLHLAFICLYIISSMQTGSQIEIIKSGPKLLYFSPNRNQFIYSFPVSPACKRRINLGKMTLKKKKKRIKTKINPLRNPRSECYQKVNVNIFLTYSI